MREYRERARLTGNERAFMEAAFAHWIAEEVSSDMNPAWLYVLGRKVLGRDFAQDATRARTS